MKCENDNSSGNPSAAKPVVLPVQFGAAFPVEFQIQRLESVSLASLLEQAKETKSLEPAVN